MIVEPDVIHKYVYILSKYLNWRFYRDLTKNNYLLKNLPNSSFFYLGSTFLKKFNDNEIKKNSKWLH